MSWGLAAAVGGNIIGGLLGQSASKKASEANERIAGRNEAMQREFAQQGIRWKVEDAKAAGIHPLAALGAQTHSANPVAIAEQPDMSMANAAQNMGQDISRAIQAKSTEDERTLAKLQIASANLDVEGKAIDNQIRASQLRKLNNPTLPPPMPKATSNDGFSEMKTIPDVGWVQREDGSVMAVPSQEIKNRIEDNFFHEAAHFWRNNIMPRFGSQGAKPPKEMLPAGADWRFSQSRGRWVPYRPK